MNALKEKILRLIRSQGPIGVAQYMHMALMDPEHGYYMRRDPFGVAGDFVTAPEVSQIFGEIVGLFFAQAWEDRGRPSPFHFVELGPGRGTLMADMLRAIRKVRPEFVAAARVALVEMSPALRAKQAETLKDHRFEWIEDLGALRDGQIFLVANEFLDALPAHQFVKSERGWHARMIAAKGDELVFAATPDADPGEFVPEPLRNAPPGSLFEFGSEAIAATRTIADLIAQFDGIALFIDYGQRLTGLGDTFQAVKAHDYADPLAEPGEADLTFHVDFAAIAQAAGEQGADVSGPITQADFLEALGIRIRAALLKKKSPEHAHEIDAAIDRLTGREQMGTLFKVLALSTLDSPPLPGF